MSRVVATAGHVDHGKSTLVRALTGRDPDRLLEERRRGLTIDLGFAWTRTGDGEPLSIVDVPGHRRFVGTMLAGLGPVPTVLLVVAADQGWQEQTSEHLAAIDALGIDHGLVVISRADLTSAERAAETRAAARAHVERTSLRGAATVTVSAVTGAGMDRLRTALDDLVATLPPVDPAAAVRLWIDRSFTISGAGTVVTGTLGGGTVRVGDPLEVRTASPSTRHAGSARREETRTVHVRGLQTRDTAVSQVGPVSRVAVNLRGVSVEDVGRGDLLITPGSTASTHVADIRLESPPEHLPPELTVHLGTLDLPVHVRPLDADHVRLSSPAPVAWQPGDRLLLRDPGTRWLAGARVLDIAPPALSRRGAARRRAALLATDDPVERVRDVLDRTGTLPAERAAGLGLDVRNLPDDLAEISGQVVRRDALATWRERLRQRLAAHHTSDPRSAGLTAQALARDLGVPTSLVAPIATAAGAQPAPGAVAGTWALPESVGLGEAADAVATLVDRLAAAPFHAPDRDDLRALGLGPRDLAAAERLGALIRLADDVVVLPDAPARAMRELATLPQPFTTSQARRALDTTRRVVIPLLEHLDTRGWTRRIDAGHREVVR